MGNIDDKKATKRCLKIFGLSVIALILLVVIVIGIMHSVQEGKYKNSLITQSEHGFEYKDNEYEYVDEVKDKPIAVAALQTQLKSQGLDYSIDKLNSLPDYFVISILETFDLGFRMGLFTIIPRFMHPDYQKAVGLVTSAFEGTDDSNVLESNVDKITPELKKMVFDVVQAYPHFEKPVERISTFEVLNESNYRTIPPKEKLFKRFPIIAYDGRNAMMELRRVG